MSTTDWAGHRASLVDHLLSGDTDGARGEIKALIANGAAAGHVYTQLLTPALHDVGRRWADGSIGVAEEHRATQICVSIVAQLGELFRRDGPVRGVAATLTPPDERHAIASAMVADVLRGAGYAVHHLGADVPVRDLAMFLAVVPVDVVCFSVTDELPEDLYPVLVAACREANPDTVVIFGGRGVDADAAARCDGLVVDDLCALADIVEQL